MGIGWSRIPVWVIALTTGILGSTITLIVSLRLTDAHKRHKLRRVLYKDLDRTYATLRHLYNYSPPVFSASEIRGFKMQQFKSVYAGAPLKYLRDNQDIYSQLPESVAFESMHELFARTANHGEKQFDTNAAAALLMVHEYVRRGSLKAKYIKRFMSQVRRKDFQEDPLTPPCWTPTSRFGRAQYGPPPSGKRA
jgi:hypothetical protein